MTDCDSYFVDFDMDHMITPTASTAPASVPQSGSPGLQRTYADVATAASVRPAPATPNVSSNPLYEEILRLKAQIAQMERDARPSMTLQPASIQTNESPIFQHESQEVAQDTPVPMTIHELNRMMQAWSESVTQSLQDTLRESVPQYVHAAMSERSPQQGDSEQRSPQRKIRRTSDPAKSPHRQGDTSPPGEDHGEERNND